MLSRHKVLNLIGIIIIASSILTGCGHTSHVSNTNHIKHVRVHKQTNKHIEKPLVVNKSHKAQHEKQSLWQKPQTKNIKNKR